MRRTLIVQLNKRVEVRAFDVAHAVSFNCYKLPLYECQGRGR